MYIYIYIYIYIYNDDYDEQQTNKAVKQFDMVFLH